MINLRFVSHSIGTRLRSEGTDIRSLVFVLTRTAAMLLLAAVLIVVLLPAALTASSR